MHRAMPTFQLNDGDSLLDDVQLNLGAPCQGSCMASGQTILNFPVLLSATFALVSASDPPNWHLS